ncbi:MAG: CARDB domain-containing protein [Kiritimatiellia bacterium]
MRSILRAIALAAALGLVVTGCEDDDDSTTVGVNLVASDFLIAGNAVINEPHVTPAVVHPVAMTVRNIGSTDATNVTVHFMVDGALANDANGGIHEVSPVPAGGEVSISSELGFNAGTYLLEMAVDPGHTTDDTDNSNNSLSGTIHVW